MTPFQHLTYIISLIDKYSDLKKVVQRFVSKTCRILKSNKTLSKEHCIAFITALKEMNEPLSQLYFTFAELARLPEVLIPFRAKIFQALCETQNQTTQTENHLKKYYEYILR
jgi:hypothetical protein